MNCFGACTTLSSNNTSRSPRKQNRYVSESPPNQSCRNALTPFHCPTSHAQRYSDNHKRKKRVLRDEVEREVLAELTSQSTEPRNPSSVQESDESKCARRRTPTKFSREERKLIAARIHERQLKRQALARQERNQKKKQRRKVASSGLAVRAIVLENFTPNTNLIN